MDRTNELRSSPTSGLQPPLENFWRLTGNEVDVQISRSGTDAICELLPTLSAVRSSQRLRLDEHPDDLGLGSAELELLGPHPHRHVVDARTQSQTFAVAIFVG